MAEHRPSRRAVLTGGAAVAGGLAVGGVVTGCGREVGPAAASASGPTLGAMTEPFHGRHQSGIVTPPQAHAALCAFDLAAGVSRAESRGVLRAWSQDAARLTRGTGGLADLQRELADGPSRLTVTIGLGARFFDRAALPERRPDWLRPLPAFPTIDRLEERWSGGDLVLQVCADDPLVVSHAVRVLSSGVRGVADPRWTQRGFRRAVGAQADGTTQRNLFGQIDGTVNPAPADADFDGLVFSDGADRRWMAGGSSLVVRRLRMELDEWEKVDRSSRELAVGRRLDTGAPLTGNVEHDPVDLQAVDEAGLPVIPEESHVARAHARIRKETILRRPYNYDDPPPPGRMSDAGLVFCSYQADPVAQFLPIQRRLAEKDALNRWIVPIGSAVFAVPPGATEGGFVGEGLFD